jgi:DNA polymerase-4
MDFSNIIFHIDYDSFFASVEQQYQTHLRGKPVGVTGSSLTKGIICAASREAKKFGVKTAMPVFKAKELCPQIICVKGDFRKYQYVHKKTVQICNKYSDLIEPFSIDELFMDMTKTLKFFGSTEEAIQKLKKDIFDAFGAYITCSVGVGPNKVLAKLTSDVNKPNGFFIVTKDNVEQLLEQTKLTDFCGVGPRIEKRLNKLGIHTVKELQQISPEVLYKEFGNSMSKFLKKLASGEGKISINHVDHKDLPKSIGHQHTLSRNTRDPLVIKRNLQRLSGMVGKRLRKNQMLGKTISIYLRDSNFNGYNQRVTINPPTDSSRRLYEEAEKIFDGLKWSKETRLVGLSVSNLQLKHLTPLPLFTEDSKVEKRDEVLDKINDKFGDFTIVPANTILADKTKGKISSFLRH